MVYKYKEIVKNNLLRSDKAKFLENIEIGDLKTIFAYILVGKIIYNDNINERSIDSKEEIQIYQQLFITKLRDIDQTFTRKDELIYEILDSASNHLYQYLELSKSII